MTESLVAGCRVLVADDSPFALELIKAILEKAGCTHLAGAGGGREALALADQSPYDVVLLDVTMPDMNGYEVTRALRARLPAPQPVIVMLTGRDIVEVEGEARSAGADGVMAKPVDRRKLLALLETLLRQRRTTIAWIGCDCSPGDVAPTPSSARRSDPASGAGWLSPRAARRRWRSRIFRP